MINGGSADGPAATLAESGHRIDWHEVDGRPMRVLVAGTPRPDVPQVVVVAGLGCVSSVIGASLAVGGWTRCTVLDVPGFGHDGPRACAPTVPAVGAAVASWLRRHASRPVVLAGHSTGAQAALRAALAVPEAVGALLLAGPTFAPQVRRAPGLVRAWVRTSRQEPSSGLSTAAPDYWRAGGPALTRYVRSGLRDRPEDAIRHLRCPVLLATGEHDYFAPTDWIVRLAASAPLGRAVTVAGAHAFPCSHPDLFSELVVDAAGAVRLPANP